jgi:hypothetical protein
VNLSWLWVVGDLVEDWLGRTRVLVLVLFGAAAELIVRIGLAPSPSGLASVGLSGSVAALIGAFLVILMNGAYETRDDENGSPYGNPDLLVVKIPPEERPMAGPGEAPRPRPELVLGAHELEKKEKTLAEGGPGFSSSIEMIPDATPKAAPAADRPSASKEDRPMGSTSFELLASKDDEGPKKEG